MVALSTTPPEPPSTGVVGVKHLVRQPGSRDICASLWVNAYGICRIALHEAEAETDTNLIRTIWVERL
jgi:hypothetical protein